MNPATSNAMDKPSCHKGTVLGTPKGIRAIITMGELNGMILAQTAIELLGLAMAGVIKENGVNTDPLIPSERLYPPIKCGGGRDGAVPPEHKL